MRKRAFLVVLLLAAVAVTTLTCSPAYVVRAGIEEARILSRRRPIAEVVNDPATGEEERRKLRLVLDARTFAAEYLELDVGESYTTFSWVDRDTLLMVVSAARKDRFQAYTWWFPIVGRVPYKGYFDFARAYLEAEALEAEGYDAWVRPSAAFSTLGWFNDPVLSTILRAGDVSLVGTVIHEVTHNTLYVPGQAAFNESFANFVGDRGAIDFFCGIEGEDGQRCRLARGVWRDDLLFGAFLSGVVAELEALYAREDLSREEILERRGFVFDSARARYGRDVAPDLEVLSFDGFMEAPLNNAALISRRLYYDRLELFEAAFQARGQDLPAVIRDIVDAARDEPADPYSAVGRLTRARSG